MTREELEAGYKRLEQEVLLLRQQLEYFKRREFGRKSERFEPHDHPELFDSEAAGKAPSSDDAAAPEDKAPAAEKDKEPRRQRRTRTERIPKDLPVVEIEAEPPAEVLRNPTAWRKTSCETHDQLEKEPGYFYVLRTVSWRYVPVDQPFAVPIMAPAKPRIILNGFFGPGLIAELLTDKYLYHLPFHRQHQLILRRYGVDIPESTMYDAAAKVGDQLGILICRMKDRMLADGVVACDETPVRCLDRTASGGSRQGYFWVYRGLTGDVIFDWQTSREHRHFAEWMGNDYEGTLVCDAYQAYINYCELQTRRGRKVRRAACLAHIRRKFEAALKERSAVAAWVLKQIRTLYRIERELNEHGASAEVRARVRQNRSEPIIRLLGKAFFYLSAAAIRPRSRLGEALHYALGQREAMKTYLYDGRVAIDNNHTERDIRPGVIGRKNWLFIGHPEAGSRAAALYSILISALNHGVNPQAYLEDIIRRLPAMRPGDLDALLPEVWAAANREQHPAAGAPTREPAVTRQPAAA